MIYEEKNECVTCCTTKERANLRTIQVIKWAVITYAVALCFSAVYVGASQENSVTIKSSGTIVCPGLTAQRPEAQTTTTWFDMFEQILRDAGSIATIITCIISVISKLGQKRNMNTRLYYVNRVP
jgi:hypothetical protein